MEWADSNVRYAPLSPTGVSLDRVPRPLDPSATVRLEVYASFEVQPTLGAGEQLLELTITMEQLMDYSAKDIREWTGFYIRVCLLTR